jgi:hypothetical protein
MSTASRPRQLRRRVQGAGSALAEIPAGQFLGEATRVESLGMELQRRSLEYRPIPKHILTRRRAHHGRWLGRGLRMKIWNGERHHDGEGKADRWAAGLCRKFMLIFRRKPSGALSQPGPEIHGEGEVAVELVRGRQGGGTEQRPAIEGIGPRDDMNCFAVAGGRRRLKTEEMQWQLHRSSDRSLERGYAILSAHLHHGLSEKAPLPSACAPLNFGGLASPSGDSPRPRVRFAISAIVERSRFRVPALTDRLCSFPSVPFSTHVNPLL